MKELIQTIFPLSFGHGQTALSQFRFFIEGQATLSDLNTLKEATGAKEIGVSGYIDNCGDLITKVDMNFGINFVPDLTN